LIIIAFLGTALVMAPIVIVWAQSGGSVDLRRNVVAGGGNTSTGQGNVQVSGTVGQPATGPQKSGGTFTQQGGFWAAILGVPAPTPTPIPGSGTLQFSAATYSTTEDCAAAVITVTRTSGSTGTVTVDYATSDGTAEQRSDYEVGFGTITFGDGVTSQEFIVLSTRDAYVENPETVNLTLSNPTGGATLGAASTATLTILDNTTMPANSQPLDDAAIFVCQAYHDFLSREPDPNGAAFWTGLITSCNGDQVCIRSRRIDVSNAFFYELEYQQTGAYVFRLYRAAYGNNQPFPNPDNSNQVESKKLPNYTVFARDRSRVVGGADLAQGQLNLANLFVLRPEFVAKYANSLSGPQFVDALLATMQIDLGVNLSSERTNLINLFNSGGRGAVLYRMADDNLSGNPINNRPFIDADYNRAFVATQYFGYLRRDADIGGFLFWLGQVNGAALRDVSRQHSMVCSFITAAEYQQRFSLVVTRNNSECP
jgi:hypothetical protein